MIKRWASLMILLIAFGVVFNAPLAEAKKFGGGKSFGRSQSVAPAQKSTSAPTQSAKKDSASQGMSKKGMLGGMLGGLLAGTVLGSLLGGLGLGGGASMMILLLLMALVGFVLFKVFRNMNRAKSIAASGHQPSPAAFGQTQSAPFEKTVFDNAPDTSASSQGGFGSAPVSNQVGDVPMNLPEGFDLNGFLNGARDHYRTLQEAWNKNDLSKMQEYLAPELFEQLKQERATLSGDQHTEVMFVDALLGRAEHTPHLAEISVRFTGKYRDTVEGVEEDITDIWHLERNLSQPNAPWVIVGIDA